MPPLSNFTKKLLSSILLNSISSIIDQKIHRLYFGLYLFLFKIILCRNPKLIITTNNFFAGVRKEQSSLTAEMQSLSDQMYDMERERERLESERLDISSQSDTLNAEINKLSAEERKLLDFKQQHIENVRRVSPDSIKAREWIQKNAFTFKGPVYGPICLEIEMKNPAAVRQIEAVIGRGTLLNFVVSSAEDNEIFRQNIMEGPDRLRVNVICVESTDQILQNIEKKYDWASMGFLGTAMDLIDGPRPVLAALAEISRIHQIPVATRENIDDEAIQRLQHPPIARYATSEAIVSISRSPYTTDILAKFVPLRPAVIIASNTVSAVDSSRLESIAKALSATRGRLAANKTRINIIIQDIRNRDEPLRRQRSEKDHLVQKIRDLVLEQKRWDDIQSTLTMRRERLNLLISNELDLSSSSPNQLQNNELNNALEEITTLIKERSRLAIGLTKLIENSFNAAMDRASTELLLSAKESRLAEAERALETAMEGTRTFQEQVEAAQELFERAKRNAKDLLARAKTCCGGRILTEEELADLSSLPDNLEELMRVERHAQVQYDVHGDASLSKRAIDEYMERASRADRLDEEAANSSTMLEKVTAQIDALSQDWVANVTLLVESISELFGTLFQRLGCAGEVQLVSAGRDYADYAISILVRFRELENLKPLSAQHHSGGEKSVATILYLLALQQDFTSLRANLKSTSLKSITNETCEREEADTDENIKDHESPNLDWQSNLIPPFRLVDEINQGMDAINERRVHDLMVEVATRTDNLNGENQASRSQYFLITPKLLPGLNYHPKMHILCVYSGEGVPEPRSLPIR